MPLSLHSSPSRLSRTRLKRAAIAVVVVGAVLFTAACSSGTGSASSTSSTPKDTLTVSLAADPSGIDPVKFNNVSNTAIYKEVNESLYQAHADGDIEPMLATALPTVSADLLTYTIPLRTGVTFTNGKAFGSDDVKFSFDTYADKANASVWSSYTGPVASIATPDAQTVVITLKTPQTYFLDQLTGLPILASNIPYTPTAYATSLVGTGPYMLKDWNKGSAIDFTANPNYWQPGLPKTKNLTFKIVPDQSATLASLLSGDIDIQTGVQPAAATTLKGRGLQVYNADKVNALFWLWPNFAPGHATTDQNLRLALAWAVDRGRVVSQVFSGFGVAESTIPALGTINYDPTIGQFFGTSADLTKAKSYLAAAGGAPSTPISLVYDNTNPTLTAMVPIIQENMTALGVTLNVQADDAATAETARSSGAFDLYLQASSALTPPTQGFLLFAQGSTQNYNKVDDPTINADALQISSTFARGSDGAVNAVHQLQTDETKIAPVIPIATAQTLYGEGKGVSGFISYAAGNYWFLAETTATK